MGEEPGEHPFPFSNKSYDFSPKMTIFNKSDQMKNFSNKQGKNVKGTLGEMIHSISGREKPQVPQCIYDHDAVHTPFFPPQHQNVNNRNRYSDCLPKNALALKSTVFSKSSAFSLHFSNFSIRLEFLQFVAEEQRRHRFILGSMFLEMTNEQGTKCGRTAVQTYQIASFLLDITDVH